MWHMGPQVRKRENLGRGEKITPIADRQMMKFCGGK